MSTATRTSNGRIGSLPNPPPSSAPFASPTRSCRQQQQQQQSSASSTHSHARSFDAGGLGSMDDVDANANITRGVETAASATSAPFEPAGAASASTASAAATASSASAAATASSASAAAFPTLPAMSASPSGAGCMSALRLAKDLSELSASKFTAAASTRITFPDGRHNLRRFFVLVTPHSGLYANASFRFQVFIPAQYPFQPPRVQCLTPVLHPNVNWRNGRVYLHLLQEEWKPVLSVNSVLFALQLLFLEPWPEANSTSADMLPSSSSGHGLSEKPSSALALASSKSATVCNTHQMSQDAVLCPEVRALILQAGGKQEFESMVRRTLAGGFVFGKQWAPNQTVQSDSSSDEGDDGECIRSTPGRGGPLHFAGLEDREPATPFETMLARVEQNGRQACVSDMQVVGSNSKGSNGHSSDRRASPYPASSTHPHVRVIKRREHITPIAELDADGDDTLADCVAPPASAISAESAHPPSRGHRRTAKIRGHPGEALAAGPSSPAASPSKRALGLLSNPSLLHTKRSHHRMAKSSPHAPNPAAEIAESRPSFQRIPDGSDRLHSHKRIRSAPAAAVLTAARSCTSNHRIVTLRAFDTPLHAAAASSSASASAVSAAPSVATGRSSRKRPSPAPAVSASQSHSASLSDGEYELAADLSADEADAEGDLNLAASASSNSRASPSATAQDDHSPAVDARRMLRRSKKQFAPGSLHAAAAALSSGTEELELAALMQGPAHSSTAFLRAHERIPQLLVQHSHHPRPASTVLPDLASFASFRPVGNPLLVAAGSSASSSSAEPVTAASSSPKRNASDCSGIAIVQAAPLDLAGARYGLPQSDEAASSSFILSGRSSSRSLNLFGTTKSIVHAAAGPGLSNLQDLQASLPATMADVD